MTPDDVKKIVDDTLRTSFANRRIGDTPTDAYQLTPKKYVDQNRFTIAVSGQPSIQGNITLSPGSNVSLSQTASIITITAGTFGGTGVDGALTISAGTTTLDLGSSAVFIKNYTSISITGTAALNFTNPNSSGTFINLKSQGDVTITSSTAPCIDVSGMGGAGGAAGVCSNASASITSGTSGTDSPLIVDGNNHYGGFGGKDGNGGGTGIAGATGSVFTVTNFYLRSSQQLTRRSINLYCGSGGGGGGGSQGAAFAGAGGNGGGALLIECGGALNFTTAGGISLNGKNGGNASVTGTGAGAGAGGGGAAGSGAILYRTLTSSSGSYTATGGNGGNGTNANSFGAPSAGGGAGACGFGGIGGGGAAGAFQNANGSNGGDAAANSGGGGGGASSGGGGTSTSGGVGGAGKSDTGALLIAQNQYII